MVIGENSTVHVFEPRCDAGFFLPVGRCVRMRVCLLRLNIEEEEVLACIRIRLGQVFRLVQVTLQMCRVERNETRLQVHTLWKKEEGILFPCRDAPPIREAESNLLEVSSSSGRVPQPSPALPL